MSRTGNIANLKPWKPGQSGNPKGRPPKGYSITEMMQQMLETTPELKAAIGKVIAKKALDGDVTAVKMLWNYMDGLPVNKNEFYGKDGEAIVVKIQDYGTHHNSSAKTKGSADDK